MSPEQAAGEFSAALNQGDLERALACLAQGSWLITPDATAVKGHEPIRHVLAQLIASEVELEVEARTVQRDGQLAMVSERWRIRSPAPGQDFHEQLSYPLLVARRIAGEWKLVHVAPWRGRAPGND